MQFFLYLISRPTPPPLFLQVAEKILDRVFVHHETEHLQLHIVFGIEVIPGMMIIARAGSGIFDEVPVFAVFLHVADDVNAVIVTGCAVAEPKLPSVVIDI
jgi:hypothetical protein